MPRFSTCSAAVVAVLTGALLLALWFLADVLLLIFAAIMVAVVLRAPTDWLRRATAMPDGFALASVLVVTLLFGALFGWFLGQAVTEQARQLAEQLPQIIESVRERVGRYEWVLDKLGSADAAGNGAEVVGRGVQIVTVTFGAILNFGLILFMAVLFAAQPSLYVQGTLRLVPPARRARIGELLQRMGTTLTRWVVGQLCLMLLVGILSLIGLHLLGVDHAWALGVLAGVLTFVPFLGPLVAAAVAVLVALATSPLLALYVALLYVGIQSLEGLLEPLVQQRAVYLPPVLLISAQLAFGVLFGALGVVLATPLAAASMVAVRMLYIEDVLGDRSSE
jgi:predicted PurR-regulated permease PerM